MTTILEAQQDTAMEQAFAARETEINNRRRDLSQQTIAIRKRASKLRARLAEMDPEDPATADLTGLLEDLAEDLQWVQYAIYVLTADALATVLEDGDVEYEHTAADVKAWCERAAELEVQHPQLRADQLGDLVRMRSVPNAPFRARYQASLRGEKEIISDVYRHLRFLEERDGVEYGAKHFVIDTKPQTRHVERMLGIQPVPTSGDGSLRLFISYELGVAFMRALGMTPQQAGL